MVGRSGKGKRARRASGSAIAELPGALLILLLLLFFPMVNMLGLATKYAACAVLNSLQLREAALLPQSQAKLPNGPVIKTIVDNWAASGLGRFVTLVAPVATQVDYKDGSTDDNSITDKLVVVTTTCQIQPFLNSKGTPFVPNVPGLNAPVTFTFVSECPLENFHNFAS